MVSGPMLELCKINKAYAEGRKVLTNLSYTLRAGEYVAIMGDSGVGKSTLLNALIGSKIAITTPKAQTTRKPVHGILSAPAGQIVFVDTPGIFKESRDALSKVLLRFVRNSLRDIDAVVYVVDPTRAIGSEEKYALSLLDNLKQPKILVINKMDLRNLPFLESMRALSPRFDKTIELSALNNTNLNLLKQTIFDFLPEGEPYYPIGQLSNMPNEEWIGELIREKLFLRLRQEVPYSVQVTVDEVTRRENGMVYIAARILTSDDRYQRMIIGSKGHGVKEIGQSARRELQAVMNAPVFLDLNVEIDSHWVERLAG